MNRTCGNMNPDARMIHGSGIRNSCQNERNCNMHHTINHTIHSAINHTISEPCSCPADIPTGSQKELLCFINEVSFAVYETILYLDTHPDDQEAMEFFKKHNHLREHALKEYARRFGPLTISTVCDHDNSCWKWMNQPWPWEGGDC